MFSSVTNNPINSLPTSPLAGPRQSADDTTEQTTTTQGHSPAPPTPTPFRFPTLPNVLAAESRLDIQSRLNGFRGWLMEGSYHGTPLLAHYLHVPVAMQGHLNLLEDVSLLAYRFLTGSGTIDRYISIMEFCKLRGSRISITTSLLYVAGDIFGESYSERISLDKHYKEVGKCVRTTLAEEYRAQNENLFSKARDYLSIYTKLKETALYKKLHKFLLYVLTLGLLKGVKLDFDSLGYKKYEQQAIERAHAPGLDMVHSMLDTVCFVCDRGTELVRTGDVSVLTHSGRSYDKWFTTASELVRNSSFLSDPEALGFSFHEFAKDLDEAIENGASIVKFTGGLDKLERMYLSKKLDELRMIKSRMITKASGQSPRPDPFAVLIHGSSSVGKSSLKQLLFYHYAKVFDLPCTMNYMYTRCPSDQYWTGFTTNKWCIVMDDIAFLNPAMGEIDPTLTELLQVKNNVPYCPPQAELEDKGRTPVKADLVIGTTNTRSLNLHAYFACPFAIARRLAYIITAKPKAEYAKNSTMVDTEKIPPLQDGEYMDIWDFVISEPRPATDTDVDAQQTKYVDTHKFSNVHKMLDWFIAAAKAHKLSQSKAMAADATMSTAEVCAVCSRITTHCKCEGDPEDDAGWSHENELDECVDLEWSDNGRMQMSDDLYQCTMCGKTSHTGNWCPCCHRCKGESRLDGCVHNSPTPHVLKPCLVCDCDVCECGYVGEIPTRFRTPQDDPDVLEWPTVTPARRARQPRRKSTNTGRRANFDKYRTYSWEQQAATMDEVASSVGHSGVPFSQVSEAHSPDVVCAPDLTDYTWDFKLKLWLVSRIVKGEKLDVDMEWIWDMYVVAFASVFLVVCLLNPVLFIFPFGLAAVYFGVVYAFVLASWFMQWRYGFYWKFLMAKRVCGTDAQARTYVMRMLGERVATSMVPSHLFKLRMFLGSAAAAVAVAAALQMAFGPSREGGPSGEAAPTWGEQGAEVSAPVPQEKEKPTFYYPDVYSNPVMDISGQSQCAQGDVLLRAVQKNTARLFFRSPSKPGIVSTTGALNVIGNIWLVNKHAVGDMEGTVDVVFTVLTQNVSGNTFKIKLSKSMFRVHPTKDFVLLELRAIRPGTNLLKYFPLAHRIGGCHQGEYVLMTKAGSLERRCVVNIAKSQCPVFSTPDSPLKGYVGKCTPASGAGDCGSAMVSTIGTAQVILGIHTSGNDIGGVFIQHISQADLNPMLSKYRPQVSMGECPISGMGAPRKLLPLHHKSAIRFIPTGTAVVMGSFAGVRPQPRSNVVPTLICKEMLTRGYVVEHAPPCMDWRAWSLALRSMVSQVHSMDQERLDRCTDAFFKDIKADVPLEKIKALHPYDESTAINGAEGVAFIDHINWNTSAGLPFRKNKRAMFEFDPVTGQGVPGPELRERIDYIWECYGRGVQAHPQFGASLKDEPTKFSKVAQGKTRVFMMAEVAFSIVARQLFLPFAKLSQEHPFAFEAMPGIVAQSKEWNELYQHVTHFGEDTGVVGDYKDYDKNMVAMMVLASFRVRIRLAEEAGWSQATITAMWCVAYDTAFAHLDINGDYISVQINPSGQSFTTFTNCDGNSIFMRYAFSMVTNFPVEDFRKYVRLATYGDDNIMGVSPACPDFNHTRIAVALSIIGVTYTMADKDAESVPYTSLRDASFLRRGFRMDHDIGTVVGPIELASINKMLTVCVRSKVLTPEAHSIAVIESAVREYFFHGREVFEAKRSMLMQVVETLHLCDWVRDSTFPTYQYLVYEFWMRFDDKTSAERFSTFRPRSAQVSAATCGLTSQTFVPHVNETTQGSALREKGTGCAASPRTQPFGSKDSSRFVAHSDELITFQDELEVHAGRSAGNNGTSMVDATLDTDIGKFFARPDLVYTYSWLSASVVGAETQIRPWSLWVSNLPTKNKLQNYAWLRGTLKLRFQVTASPFLYGWVRVAYQPLPLLTPTTITKDAGVRWLIPMSQRSHLDIELGEDKTYVMELPFMFHKNWLDVSVLSEFTNMGALSFVVYEPLRGANGSVPTTLPINVFASMEDIVLSGATMAFAAQSDEYGEGCVSQPASWVARAASYLEKVPIIGPFATATRIGASAIASIASIFGFTNVPVIADTMPHRPEAFPKLASSEIGFPIEKLALDPKNELSIDPRLVGMPGGTDEMSILSLVGRESWLTRFDWLSSDGVNSAKFVTRINPMMYDNDGAAESKVYMTPMCFVANAFTSWRGTIVIRFKFVASKYHKGKVLVRYDPTGGSFNIVQDTAYMNTTHNAVVDLAVTHDFEMRIPYQQATQFQTIRPSLTAGNKNFSTTAFTWAGLNNREYDNGVLIMRVMNPLTGPSLSSTVGVHVFVRAEPDLEFANPSELDNSHRLSLFVAQSEEFSEQPLVDDMPLCSPGGYLPEQYLIHFGENIKSIRQLMHRYSMVAMDQVPAAAVPSTMTVWRKNFYKMPRSPGFSSAGTYAATKLTVAGTHPYNFTSMTPMAYFTPAFLCYRGGVNWTFNVIAKEPVKSLRIYRDNINGTPAGITAVSRLITGAGVVPSMINNLEAGAAGQALTNQLTNSGLNVCCPMYSNFKFMSTDPLHANQGVVEDGSILELCVLEGKFPYPNTSVDDSVTIESYCASAPDFSLHYFLNVPTFFLYSAMPVPA